MEASPPWSFMSHSFKPAWVQGGRQPGTVPQPSGRRLRFHRFVTATTSLSVSTRPSAQVFEVPVAGGLCGHSLVAHVGVEVTAMEEHELLGLVGTVVNVE